MQKVDGYLYELEMRNFWKNKTFIFSVQHDFPKNKTYLLFYSVIFYNRKLQNRNLEKKRETEIMYAISNEKC